MSHATSSHDEKCHRARCRPLERPCDCSWCRKFRGEKPEANRLAPFLANPCQLAVVRPDEDAQQLVFVEGNGRCQKCSDCWFNWFDQELCQEAPCNSQDRTDGRMGTWQEPGRRGEG